MALRVSDKTVEENQIVEEAKHWEDLYYKENALVGLLINKVKFLEAQVDYLKSELAYTKKYEVNHDIK